MAEHAETVDTSRAPERPREHERETTHRPWWQIVLIGAGTLALGIGLLYFIRLVARPLALALLGIVIASALSPVVDWLGRRMPRGVALALVYLLLVVIIVAAGWFIIPPLVNELLAVIGNIPDYLETVQEWIEARPWLNNGVVLDTLSSQAVGLGTQAISLPITLTSAFFDLVLILFVSVYWQIESDKLNAFFLSLFPPRQRSETSRVLRQIGHAMGGYIRAVMLSVLFIGGLAYIGLSIIGVPYTLALSVLVGVGQFVPLIGPTVATIPVALVALLSSPTKALITLGFMLVLQQLESNVVTPNIMHSQTKISPLLVLLALFVGGVVGGLIGVLVAVPLAAAGRVLIVEMLAPAIRRRTGAAGHPVEQDESA
ncbi:MAG: AI-2E family transporter [Aggregatilineales bacterium]|nr:AI-2E family transporter [Chloroflexota bacterium]HOA24513.1 AI-2E family transporter [Aggregatilineales bacterium]HPV05676.1 AI-2E family transporter [Aggregatilineales bacterium]